MVLLGDLNARVGNRVIDGVVARYGVQGVNDSGVRLTEMCAGQELAIGNTFFKKKKTKHPWGRVVRGKMVEKALMDYVIVRKRSLGRLRDVHVYRGYFGPLSGTG